MTNCGHYFCSLCLSGVFKNASSNTIHCPTCECIVHFDDIQLIQKKFKEQLLDLNVKCLMCDKSESYQRIHYICSRTISQSLDMNATECDFLNSIMVQSTPKSGIHLSSNAQTSAEIQTSPSLRETLQKEKQSLEQSLQRSVSSSLSKQEEILHTKLTKRKLLFAADKSIVLARLVVNI